MSPVHADGEDPAPRADAQSARAPGARAFVRIIDMHSHWGTRRGYPFQPAEELVQQERAFKSKPRYATEAEMAEHFRKTGVRVMLDLGLRRSQSIDVARTLHDYASATQRDHLDVIIATGCTSTRATAAPLSTSSIAVCAPRRASSVSACPAEASTCPPTI